MSVRFGAIILAAMVMVPGCLDSGGPDLIGKEYREPPVAPNFTLINQSGEEVSLSDFAGEVVVVAFIYTSCPDVCLAISSNLDYIHDNLGEYHESVNIISITIDPARDTIGHLHNWTENMGYEWNHLTHDKGSEIQQVWDDWNVVVDASHIANSLPPDDAMVRFAVLYPDNSTFATDTKCIDPWNGSCFENGASLAEFAFNSSGIGYDIERGTIGNWTSNDSWTWGLYSWNSTNETWVKEAINDPSTIEVGLDTNLAWVASGANISNLPEGVDCDGRGWIMGQGEYAHCMCDDGWEREKGDWLSCIQKGSSDSSADEGHANGNNSESSDPHDESLLRYEVGHTTVTFIIDKEGKKRVYYSGINWDVDEFLHDIRELADE